MGTVVAGLTRGDCCLLEANITYALSCGLWSNCHSLPNIELHESKMFFVLKVLQKLPEGLAISVLAAAPAPLGKQLSILPKSLHPLAVEAAFPSIATTPSHST
jgi:hypothetical protein